MVEFLNDDRDPYNNYFEIVNNHENPRYITTEDFNSHLCSLPQKITFFHHNIRSFNANSDFILSTFRSPDYYPEVLVFSETWFKPETQSSIQGYSAFHTIREQGRSGGVSIFV